MNILKRKGRSRSNWRRADGPRNGTVAENNQYTEKRTQCPLSLKRLSNSKNYKLYIRRRRQQITSARSAEVVIALIAEVVTLIQVVVAEVTAVLVVIGETVVALAVILRVSKVIISSSSNSQLLVA